MTLPISRRVASRTRFKKRYRFMDVTPTSTGALRVSDPTPNLRYDMGNLRLFATLDGAGNIPFFYLPEGVVVLRDWQVRAWLDGVQVRWSEAEAIGRSWTLHGMTLDVDVTLRTVCDVDHPALVQVWRVANTGLFARVFTLDLDVTFDLRVPTVRVGTSAFSARLHQLVHDNALVRWALGDWRWSVLDRIEKAQKRFRPEARRKPDEVELLHNGLRARGDITATLRASDGPATIELHLNGATLHYRAVIEPGETYTLPFEVTAGDGADPAMYHVALADADEYAGWLVSAFEHAEPVLRSLYVACLNVATAMYKELPSGFAGLWAGPGYAYPPRIYFRDGYWTALAILPYRPEWVRAHLVVLATGVHADGVCPSGVIDLAILPFEDQDEEGATDWLPDHQDSPAYFVLLLYEYLAWTGDMSLLQERLDDGRTIWACAQGCLNRLTANPAKEHAPNDWTDNVLRSEWVTYDLALLVGALNAGAEIARNIGESDTASSYARDAYQIGQLIQIHAWDDVQGYYIDYRRTGDYGGQPFVETHLALDTLLALRFDAAPPERAEQVLTCARDRLQTRHNMFQPHEDWGVMCCWPTYSRHADLFAKSAQPYNYHNGAEWPYLSAMYAQLLLERDDPDWHYVLTRWWEIQLEKGWLTPVEYHTPAHPVGAFLQGWSGAAVGAMLAGGLNLRPALNGKIAPRVPPWGGSTFHHLVIRGQERTITVGPEGVQIT
jgi:hypothetical protein